MIPILAMILLKANLGLGWEDCQQAVIDEFLFMVAGCALETNVCHWMLKKSQHGSMSTKFPFKRFSPSLTSNSITAK